MRKNDIKIVVWFVRNVIENVIKCYNKVLYFFFYIFYQIIYLVIFLYVVRCGVCLDLVRSLKDLFIDRFLLEKFVYLLL